MKRNNPPFSRRGGGRGSSFGRGNDSERSNTPSSSSWRTLQKRKTESESLDFISHEPMPEPFVQIARQEVDWISKKPEEVMFFLEQEDIPFLNDAERLRQKYLDTNFYPTLELKSRAWLKTMMLQKGMEIIHFWSTDNHSLPPSYSKCIIREVILPRQWAINPNQALPLVKAHNSKEVYSFNYWDYVDAFHKIFLYQNPKNKHTWLIKLCPEAISKGLPTWFFNWWHIYGAEFDILPDPIQKLYPAWIDSHPIISKMNENEIVDKLCLVYFFAEAEIPWIWTWSFEAAFTEGHLPYLKRQYYHRWWSGINVKEKELQVQEIIHQNTKILETTIAQSLQTENPLNKVAKMLRRKYPQATMTEIQKKCLEYMKTQFMAMFEITDIESPKSSETSDTQPENTIMQDAQDPAQDQDKDTDLWEAAMGLLADITPDKGKQKMDAT